MGRHASLAWTITAARLATESGLPDCNAWLAHMLQLGHTFNDIAQAIGVTSWRVATYCHREGLSENWNPKHAVIRAVERTATEAGYASPSAMANTLIRSMTWHSAAATMGISVSTMRRLVKQEEPAAEAVPGAADFCKCNPCYAYMVPALVSAAQRVNNRAALHTLARLAFKDTDEPFLELTDEEEEFLRQCALERIIA